MEGAFENHFSLGRGREAWIERENPRGGEG